MIYYIMLAFGQQRVLSAAAPNESRQTINRVQYFNSLRSKCCSLLIFLLLLNGCRSQREFGNFPRGLSEKILNTNDVFAADLSGYEKICVVFEYKYISKVIESTVDLADSVQIPFGLDYVHENFISIVLIDDGNVSGRMFSYSELYPVNSVLNECVDTKNNMLVFSRKGAALGEARLFDLNNPNQITKFK